MTTRNSLPFSNQFERGHSFNWAGIWTEGKYYLNDEYVTDFAICDNMLLSCRKNHEATNENKPIPIWSNNKIIGVESIYWSFIADLTKVAYVPNYDPVTGNIVWTRTDIDVTSPSISQPIGIDQIIENKLDAKAHCYLSESAYEALVESGEVDENVTYFTYEDEDS